MKVLEHLVGHYGQDYVNAGILVDNVGKALDLGATLHTTERWQWLTTGKGEAKRVVCGDLVMVHDSEGFPGDGRCGLPVDRDRGSCQGHADERDAWLGMSEIERRHLERLEDLHTP